ncbi:keratinocyte-associated protein 3-like, partial [Rhineura floridana]|uniref:keratinocyte-associated protein 3-like n=1 Tax=Rhineura floridana TaxID=261503 RepID=UPI002AC813CC
LGHLTLVLGAIVHGALLRHVAQPVHTITSEYAVGNVVAVASGLLSIAASVLAILVSRSFSHHYLPWILVVISLTNFLISGACCVGLALAISLTVVNGGRHLFTGCYSSALPADACTVITNKCPFDTTSIYDTALVLWLPSLLMAAVKAGLSAWCCTASLSLCGILDFGACSSEKRALFHFRRPSPPPEVARGRKAGGQARPGQQSSFHRSATVAKPGVMKGNWLGCYPSAAYILPPNASN